jgi:3',5'-cyclic AMP phosphodiesterase CpdA
MLGWLNLMLRRRAVFADGLVKLAALERTVDDEAVDVVVLTGDVSHLGTRAELEFCREALRPLIASVPAFICMPGNHDVYLSRRAYREVFGELAWCGESLCAGGEWPRLFRFGELEVVVLDSTKPNPHLYSTGRIPDAQLQALERYFESASGRIVVATHFGLYGNGGVEDRRSHGIVNAAAYRRVLEMAPAGTVCLHGHTHHAFRMDPDGLPTQLCAGSTTFAGREGVWLLACDGAEGAVRRGHWDGERYAFAAPLPLPSS